VSSLVVREKKSKSPHLATSARSGAPSDISLISIYKGWVGSAEEFEDFAGAFDHLFLMGSGVDEFDAVIESRAVADYAVEIKFDGLVGNREFERQAGAGFEFAGQEQAHAAAADIGGLSVVVEAVSVQKYRDLNRNRGVVALPAARVLPCATIQVGRWFRC